MMKNNVLLIHPEISRTKYNYTGIIENEPLELEYISAILQQEEYDVEIFDKAVEKGNLKEKIETFRPNYLYICGRTRQENFMKEYCELAKNIDTKIITIVGGIHVQHNYERLYTDKIDYILTTFDVYKILDIINFEEKSTSNLLRNIKGICYKEDGNWIKNDSEPFDINRLPLPDRTYFYNNLEHYRYLELLPCAHVRTSYSCVYNCKFCYRNSLNYGKYVSRDIESVVAEIENIKCDNIFIIDDDFFISPKRLKRFIELIKEKNIKKKYVCYGRVDFIINNKELIKELKEIGFYYILVGLEAIENQRLDNYNKRTNINSNIECINLLNEIGINIMGLLIIDLDFDVKDFKKIYKWVKKYNLKHVAISIFTPELGLEIYDMYKDRIITQNPEHWDYLHVVARPSKMSIGKYYYYYYVLLIKLMLRAQRQGVYDFIDYKDYIKSFAINIFKKEKG